MTSESCCAPSHRRWRARGKVRQASKVYRAAAEGAPTMERHRLRLRAGELLFADGDIEEALNTLAPVPGTLRLNSSRRGSNLC